MLHPRVPPTIRALPPLQNIALLQSEEGKDERETREALSLRSIVAEKSVMDVDGMDVQDSTTVTVLPAQKFPQTIPETSIPLQSSQLTTPLANILPVVSPVTIGQGSSPTTMMPIDQCTSVEVTTVEENVEFRVTTTPRDQHTAVRHDAQTPPIEDSSHILDAHARDTFVSPVSAALEPEFIEKHESMAIDSDEEIMDLPVVNPESDTDSEEY